MTWKEFKEELDRELKAQGIDENTEIWYIDVSFPTIPLKVVADHSISYDHLLLRVVG